MAFSRCSTADDSSKASTLSSEKNTFSVGQYIKNLAISKDMKCLLKDYMKNPPIIREVNQYLLALENNKLLKSLMASQVENFNPAPRLIVRMVYSCNTAYNNLICNGR
jgi:hypothetical protein